MTDLTSVREHFGKLAERISVGDEAPLRDLERLVGGAAAEGNAEQVAWLRLGLDQLASHELRQAVSTRLSALDSVLEGTQAQLDASRARRLREDARQTLKERIVETLEMRGVMRPKDLVESCGTDAYQVSRALRDLKGAGVIEASDPPDISEGLDGRAVWYRLSSPAAMAPDAIQPVPAGPRVFELKTVREGTFAGTVRVQPIVHDVDIWGSREDPAVVDPARAVIRLASAWLAILLDDGLPRGAAPSNLDALEGSSREWNEFASNHDLARVLGVQSCAPIWLSREGNSCWILTRSSATQAPLTEVVAELSEMGEALVKAAEDADLALATTARLDWEGRAEQSVLTQISAVTRIDAAVLSEFSDEADASAFWEYDDPFELSELLAAARMAARLPTAAMKDLIEVVRNAKKTETTELDSIADSACAFLRGQHQLRPYEQGYLLANWLRAEISEWEPTSPVDPEALLEVWGVPVLLAVTDRSIDAFACWGPRHGPMVAVNEVGRHSESTAGRRATLAHEIAHLLVDREDALPLAEVLGGKVAPIAESRARAFAAELLLPREIAGSELAQSAEPSRDVERISRRYGVSREIIAWQARNSDHYLPHRVYDYLRTLVPGGRGF